MLCYCIQIIFTSSIRNRDDTCFRCFKQAVALWFRFPAWVQRAPSVALLRLSRGRFVLLRLLSCGDLKLLRDVTGKAVSEAVWCEVLQCCGVYTVFDPCIICLGRSWGEGPAGRPGRPCDVGERVSFEQEESYKRESCTQARCFKLSGLDIAHRRLVQSVSVWGGAPPMSRLSGVEFTWSGIPFIPWKIQTYRFYMHV